MSAVLLIYLASVVDGLKNGFIALALATAAICFLFAPILLDFETEKIMKMAWRVVPCVILSGLIAILIPDKQTVYMMAAAKVGQDIVEAPQTKEIGGKILNLINQKLDEQLKDTK